MREELTAGGHPRGANACAPFFSCGSKRTLEHLSQPALMRLRGPEGGGLAADMPREQAHSLVPKRRSPERATRRLWYSDATQKTPKGRGHREITRPYLFVRPKGPHLELQQRPNDAVVAASFGNDVL